MNNEICIKPQEGPQEDFLSSSADIAIYGGSAGGGKTYALLLEPVNYILDYKGFGVVIFRRTSPQIRNEGGLWDTSFEIYPHLGAAPKQSILEWQFGNGNKLKFSHMEHEKNKNDWQGSQVPLICFDELTHFTKDQFFYMLSRNRSTCGVQPYIRATCNPEADSWVADFISWWIDQDTGYAIPERSGKVRWFVRLADKMLWYDSRKEAINDNKGHSDEIEPKSVTFIRASIYDNKILLEKNPAYLANLNALSNYERLKLKEGNWKVRPSSGMFFKREWFEILDAIPAGGQEVRFWDRAATEVSEKNSDPDFTAGLKMKKINGIYYITDLRHMRARPQDVESSVKNCGIQDGVGCNIGLEQEPGASGKAEIAYYMKLLAGFIVKVYPATKDKVTRSLPLSAQAQQGNVKILRANWNEKFLTEMDNFDGESGHDDIVDAASGAFNHLVSTGNFNVWTA